MEIDKAKDIIIKLYQKALYVSNCKPDNHPIRIIESCKSLIGIDVDNPNGKLLEFSKIYCEKFSLNEIIFDAQKLKTPIVVTFLDLELSLLDNEMDKSFENVYFLSKVSDGRQILEFLLEFSIKYCSQTFLLIWSVLRMELFSGLSNVLPSLFMCVQYIIKDDKKLKKENLNNLDEILEKNTVSKKSLNIFLTLYRIYNEDIVRKIKINPFIVSAIKNNCSIKKGVQDKIVLDNQIKLGRIWISNYLNDLDYYKYNKNLIIDLDAFRGCIKISNIFKNEELIWTYLNKTI